ncbi:integrase core domain-containing protein [uncultured Pseudokineococcus sp.]|uniref:integrase core domain-containing protein n=1 Tax=uncultured Pseudokineococcus sp. TaxID=1642928 RepID=UPI00262973CB|nr:integrase core domain-containing protein [uncultured Pseudokineococcus sp.]
MAALRRLRHTRHPGRPYTTLLDATAEAFNSLFKAELVRNKGPWKNVDDLEIATAEYVDWFNHRRLHGELGHVPPAEYEADHHQHHPAPATVRASLQSLH